SGAQQIFGSIRDQQLYRKDPMPAGSPLRRSLFPPSSGAAVCIPAAPCFLASPSSLLRLRSVTVIFSATSSHRLASGPPLLSIGGVAPAGPPNWPPPPPPLTGEPLRLGGV